MTPSSWRRDLALALAAVTVATLLRLALDTTLGDIDPFVVHLAAIALVAWFGTTPAAVLALLISGVLAVYLFIAPRHAFAPDDARVLLGVALHVVVAAVVIAMSHAMRLARRRAEELLADATAREAGLRTSEARFRELADAMPQIVYETDADGRVLFANRQWLEYTGQSEAQTADLGAVVHPDELGDMVQRSVAARQSGTTLEAEFRLRSASDGQYRWFLTRAVPVRDEAGQVIKWFGTSTDIHEQKQTARRLAESEALYRAIGESIEFGVWVCDATGRNTYVSESFLRLVGLTQQQWSDRGWRAALHPDDADAISAAWQECVRTRGTWDQECRFKGTDGQWHEVLARGVPLTDAAGTLLGWAGINLDISRLVSTEREVVRLAAESERQRRLYETVLTNTPDFVYVFSLDHRVLYANDALLRMWGRTHDEATGKTFLDLGYETWHAEMHDREIDQVRATRQPVRGEVPFTGTHGRRLYDYIFVPVMGADGEVEAVAGTTRDVTERKEAERAVQAGEERLRTALTAARMVAWEWTPVDRRLRVSENAAEVFGLPAGVGLTGLDQGLALLHPDDVGKYKETFRQAIADRTGYLTTYRIVRPDDGRVVWIEERGHTVFDQPEGGARLFGVSMDVTDHRRAEEVLRASDARHTYLVELADTLRPLPDPAAVRAEASRVLGQRLGAHRVAYFEVEGDTFVLEEHYTDGVAALAGRYSLESFGRDLLEIYRSGRTAVEADVEADASRPARERAAFAGIQTRAYIGVPLVKAGAFVAGLAVHSACPRAWTPTEIAMAEDTAERTWAAVERVRAEREVARLAAEADRERRLFAAVLSNTPDFLYTFDLDGRFVYVNAALLSLWGRDLDNAVGKNFFELDYPPALAERLHQQIQRVIETKQPVRDETSFTGAQGERMYEYILAPVLGAGDRVEAVAGSTRDITDRKVAEAERERLVSQLREQDRRKDEFLATLAHELRNPLAPIRNGLQVIRLSGAGGTIEQVRSMMERQLGHLTRLVDDLLDVSRVTSGKLQLRRTRVALRTVIDAAVETSRPEIEQAGHHLTVDVPDTPIVVDGDPIRLAQVVSNLLTNSARYTHRDGHIRVEVSCDGPDAVVTVSDDGIGIPPAMLDAVFGMFTQVDSRLEKTTGGLGIGLSLVKGLVEMHGGTIEARSEGEGRGSQFSVRLPLAASLAGEPDAVEGERAGALPTGLRRVLVLDDNVDSADSLAQWLAMFGNEVRTAYDGEAGVEAARQFRPCVVLCDIGMPKVNGYDVARRIRAEPWGRNIVLVALTGWGQQDDRQRSADAGFNHHLVKPVADTALMQVLAQVP
ncbi:PAS domain S-box protein [Luteitalea sp.]